MKKTIDPLMQNMEEYEQAVKFAQQEASDWKIGYLEEREKAKGYKEERDNLWKEIALHTPAQVRQELPDLVAYLDTCSGYEDTITKLKKGWEDEKRMLVYEIEKLKKENDTLKAAIDRHGESITKVEESMSALTKETAKKKPLDGLRMWLQRKGTL